MKIFYMRNSSGLPVIIILSLITLNFSCKTKIGDINILANQRTVIYAKQDVDRNVFVSYYTLNRYEDTFRHLYNSLNDPKVSYLNGNYQIVLRSNPAEIVGGYEITLCIEGDVLSKATNYRYSDLKGQLPTEIENILVIVDTTNENSVIFGIRANGQTANWDGLSNGAEYIINGAFEVLKSKILHENIVKDHLEH